MTSKPDSLHLRILKIISYCAAIVIGGLITITGSPIKYILPAGVLGLLAIIIGTHNISIPLYIFIVSLGLGEILQTELLATTFLVIPGVFLGLSWLFRIILSESQIKFDVTGIALTFSLGIWSSISSHMHGSVMSSRPYWFVIILFLLLLNYYHKTDDFISAGWVLLITLSFISLVVFFDRVLLFVNAGGQISIFNLHKAYLPFGDKNTVGMYISFGIPVAYFLANMQSTAWKKTLLRLMLGILALGVFSVFSLGVMIGVLTMAFLIIVFDWQTIKQNRRFLFVALIILLIYVAGPMYDRIQGQLELVLEKGILALGTNRLFLWSTSFKVIQDAPWFGHGVGVKPITNAAYSYVPQEYWDLIVIGRGDYIIPHNSILTVATQIGIPGAILFGLIQVWILFIVFKSKIELVAGNPDLRNLVNMFFIILVGGFVQGQALSAQLDKMTWFIMGSSLALVSLISSVQNNQREING